MLSIPRELQVTFTAPNGEVITNRINSAYTYGYEDGGGVSGGVKLMVETIKHVLGIPVINHVFVTNFKRFERAVNEMGCVYMTVDKRYYHSNANPAPNSTSKSTSSPAISGCAASRRSNSWPTATKAPR